ncbi:hypothetical protein OAN61_01085, partial [bacterium]|nr:hypothetical protein [bacterium]
HSTTLFVLQAFAKHNVRVTLVTCLVPLVCCSFMFSICERLVDETLSSWPNAIYSMYVICPSFDDE